MRCKLCRRRAADRIARKHDALDRLRTAAWMRVARASRLMALVRRRDKMARAFACKRTTARNCAVSFLA
eukprot:4937001-Prymnesium_polylepis.2